MSRIERETVFGGSPKWVIAVKEGECFHVLAHDGTKVGMDISAAKLFYSEAQAKQAALIYGAVVYHLHYEFTREVK